MCIRDRFRTGAGIGGHPPQTQGLTAFRAHFHRHLVGCAADTAGLDLQLGHDVFHRLLKNLQGVLFGFFTDDVERTVDDFLGYAPLAVYHDVVDESGYQFGIVKRVRQNIAFCYGTSSRHFTSLLHII